MKKFISKFLPLLLLSSSVSALEYGVGPLNENDTIYFNSSAKLEFIQGKTQHINGRFSFDPDNPDSPVDAKVRVDLRTLETGIAKRDEHMRDNHLHTVEFPYAYFELDSIQPPVLLRVLDSVYTTKASGKFYICGNFRNVTTALALTRNRLSNGSEEIIVRSKFSINLDDFKISRPKALF
ncbi:MAG TPA: YceI family protein, partial [candidate division Zixibacteria bacterium]|nr:YceI family protein [candidate division Zixibacteria bacterium]